MAFQGFGKKTVTHGVPVTSRLPVGVFFPHTDKKVENPGMIRSFGLGEPGRRGGASCKAWSKGRGGRGSPHALVQPCWPLSSSRTEDARVAVHPRGHAEPPAVLPPQLGRSEPGGLCRKAPVCSWHRPVDPHPKPRVQGQGGLRWAAASPGVHRGRVPAAWMSAAFTSPRFSRKEGFSGYCSLGGKGRASPAEHARFSF